jgi:putative peptidoglycan lipid II flippase
MSSADGYGDSGYNGQRGYQGPTGYQGAVDHQGGYERGYPDARRGGGRMRLVLAGVAVIVLGVVIYLVGFNKPAPATSAAGMTPTTSASAAAGTVLPISADLTFNPFGTPAGDTEDPTTAKNAIDGDPASFWATSFYIGSSQFAGLKKGTGLVIDMGKPVKLSQVDVTFSADGITGPTTASIYLGNDPTATAAGGLSGFTQVSASATATGDHAYPVSSSATGRYVLIWITNLPALQQPPQGQDPGKQYFEARISNVVVKGSAATGNS